MVEQTAPSLLSEGARRISLLLAHHGTEGARRVEPIAFQLAQQWQAEIVHLLVVPEFWQDMMGDDWLNNASTRQLFGSYLENLLSREALEQVRSLEARCQALHLEYDARIRFGDPTTCLLEYAKIVQPAMVVMGSPRPKGVPGLRSRMRILDLMRGLTVPLLIVPWIHE
ncbi:MAG: universal stress protein [Magnetococcus sp. YQC-5]